jgi:hypothetical protein
MRADAKIFRIRTIALTVLVLVFVFTAVHPEFSFASPGTALPTHKFDTAYPADAVLIGNSLWTNGGTNIYKLNKNDLTVQATIPSPIALAQTRDMFSDGTFLWLISEQGQLVKVNESSASIAATYSYAGVNPTLESTYDCDGFWNYYGDDLVTDDGQGNLLIVNNSTICKIDKNNGMVVDLWWRPPVPTYGRPGGILRSGQYVYLTQLATTSDGIITRYDANTGADSQADVILHALNDNVSGSAGYLPSEMTVAENGDILVIQRRESFIWRLRPDTLAEVAANNAPGNHANITSSIGNKVVVTGRRGSVDPYYHASCFYDFPFSKNEVHAPYELLGGGVGTSSSDPVKSIMEGTVLYFATALNIARYDLTDFLADICPSKSPAHLSIYDGTLWVVERSYPYNTMKLGNAGRDVQSSYRIYLQPNDSNPLSSFAGGAVAGFSEPLQYLVMDSALGPFHTLEARSSDAPAVKAVQYGSDRAALFKGNVNVDGDIVVMGGATKSAVVQTSRGEVPLFTAEAPEARFADYGTGTLAEGEARIDLDPVFLETIAEQDDYHVTLTALGEPVPLAVTEQDKTGFTVRGAGDVAFMYEVVALRRGYEHERFGGRQ